MYKLKLNEKLKEDVSNNYVKAIDIVKFLLEDDKVTIKVTSLDFAKSKEENINNLAIKDLRYNFKNIVSAMISNEYLVIVTD